MIGDGGQTTPPPWVPLAAAGCNVGGVSAANIELENANTSSTGDIARVYGNPSPEFTEAGANPTLAAADFIGIAIHCAKNAAPCQGNAHSRPDDQTTVPGSNDGYLGLFGAKYVNPAITGGNACVNDTDGNPIKDPTNTYCGFPGFDGAFAKNSLGMVAQMQENGVPVTYAYISDAHDNHSNATAWTGRSRLQAAAEGLRHGVRQVLHAALERRHQQVEHAVRLHRRRGRPLRRRHGDVGRRGQPDVHACALLEHVRAPVEPDRRGDREPQGHSLRLRPERHDGLHIHFDDAPTVYVNGNPSRADPVVRKLEQDSAAITGADPYADPPGPRCRSRSASPTRSRRRRCT